MSWTLSGFDKIFKSGQFSWSRSHIEKRFHFCTVITLGGREIKALGIRCNNSHEGCGWEGTIGDRNQHLDKCDYSIVKCPNCCDKDLLRKDLQHHIAQLCSEREYECHDCHEKDVYRVITGPHQDVCERKKVKCANNECGCILERRLVQDHVAQDCDFTEVSCKYAMLGCQKKMIRMGIKIHEDDNEVHLSVAMTSIIDLNKKVLELQGHVEKLQWQVKGGALASIKVSDYSNKKGNDVMYQPEPFLTSYNGYKMEMWIYTNGSEAVPGTHLSVYLHVLNGPFDSQLSWPLLGTFKIELLNQLEDDNHHAASVKFIENECGLPGSASGWGIEEFIEQSALKLDSSKNIQYLKDDTLYFKVFLESCIQHKCWLD